MLPVAVLVTGTPVPATLETRGPFGQLIREAAHGAWPGEWRDLDCEADEDLPPTRCFSALVITGSPASVTTRDRWMLRAEAYLRRAVAGGTPVLGICFGHQLLAQALGGDVQRNPRGREMGSVALELTADDPLLDVPERPICVNMSHVDSVVRTPPGARVLASTALEPHAALRFAERAWSVQFHPEFDAYVMRQYIEARRDIIAGEGLDPDSMLSASDDAPFGAAVLRRFLGMIR